MESATIGIRELRDGLSRHLAAVRAGGEITITDHGKPVARIVPVGPTKLEKLIAEGRVIPAEDPNGWVPEPLPLNPISDLIER